MIREGLGKMSESHGESATVNNSASRLRAMQVPLLQGDAMDAKTFEAALIRKIAWRIFAANLDLLLHRLH